MKKERKSLAERTQTEPISADIARRIALNAERNPREQYNTYGEPTSTINPLTGESYDFRHLFDYDTSVLEALHIEQLKKMQDEPQAISNVNPITGKDYLPSTPRPRLSGERSPKTFKLAPTLLNDKHSIKYVLEDFSYISNVKNSKKSGIHLSESEEDCSVFLEDSVLTSEFFELQRALGRMEVREGKLPREQYDSFNKQLTLLSQKFKEAQLPLECITTVGGMDVALNNVLDFSSVTEMILRLKKNEESPVFIKEEHMHSKYNRLIKEEFPLKDESMHSKYNKLIREYFPE